MLIDRVRAEVLVQIGRLDDARDIVDEYLRHHPTDEGGSFTSMKALLFAKDGQHRRAEQMIDRATAIGKSFGHFHHTAYNIASAYAALNEPDEAVRWLEAAADDGFPCYPYFANDPNLEPLRAQPRFQGLMTTLQRQSDRFKQLAAASDAHRYQSKFGWTYLGCPRLKHRWRRGPHDDHYHHCI